MQRVVEETPSDLNQYGLNPPRIDLSFRESGSKEFQRLLIGEKTPEYMNCAWVPPMVKTAAPDARPRAAARASRCRSHCR